MFVCLSMDKQEYQVGYAPKLGYDCVKDLSKDYQSQTGCAHIEIAAIDPLAHTSSHFLAWL